MKKAKFTINGWLDISEKGMFEGYTDGSKWNGCEKPYFTKEECIRMIPFIQPTRYDDATDTFIVESDGGKKVYESEVIVVKGEKVKVFAIGNGCWRWKEANYFVNFNFINEN